jgi:hypothetical protein
MMLWILAALCFVAAIILAAEYAVNDYHEDDER